MCTTNLCAAVILDFCSLILKQRYLKKKQTKKKNKKKKTSNQIYIKLSGNFHKHTYNKLIEALRNKSRNNVLQKKIVGA